MESAVRANKSQINPESALVEPTSDGAHSLILAKPVKIRMALKILVFCCSTVTLSWFFEGLRQIKESSDLQASVVLLAGTVLTLALVALQGFFIYCEERSKGNKIRKIALFETWYENLTKQKGDSTNRG